jgi:large subunit ribosomal protein L21
MYAIIQSGGKQHKVAKGEVFQIEKIDKNVGDKVEFTEVLFVGGDKTAPKVGQPYLPDARVVGSVVTEDRAPKILVFKKKHRKQYRRTKGHRQGFTAVRVEDIIA